MATSASRLQIGKVNTPGGLPTAAREGFAHEPVLAGAVAELVPAGARLLVDATVGGGGHAELLLGRFPGAVLFGCDRDPEAVEAARRRLAPFGERALVKHLPYSRLHHYVVLGTVNFLLVDLGVSSHQLDVPGRGFSFTRDGPLDMRMDPGSGGLTAADLVNTASEERLREILYRLGEERFAPRIVKAILAARAAAPLRTTGELARIVAGAVPARFHRKGHHPATQTFQALRMALNGELEELAALLDRAPALLAPGGRIVVIAFHSLEDRLVKSRFHEWEHPCVCPPDLPRCVCGRLPLGRRVTRKPVLPEGEELRRNPRSRSAKLRAFERVAETLPAEGAP